MNKQTQENYTVFWLCKHKQLIIKHKSSNSAATRTHYTLIPIFCSHNCPSSIAGVDHLKESMYNTTAVKENIFQGPEPLRSPSSIILV